MQVSCIKLRLIGFSIFALFLTACTTLLPDVKLTDTFWKNKKQKIVIAAVKPSEPHLYTTGAQGMLDVVITGSVMKEVDQAINKMDLSWYQKLPPKFVERLKQQGIEATYYPEPINDKETNYITYLKKTHSDKILLIRLERNGAERIYYGFIPLGKPKAICNLSGELIDKNNKTLWRYKIRQIEEIVDEWDEAPHYTNLINTINSATKYAEQKLLNNFFQHQ